MRQVGCTAIGYAWHRLACLTAVVLLGLTQWALAEPLPHLVRVTGLQADDVLNVRAQQSARSVDLGDLKPGDIVEVIAYSADANWARIAWQEGNGWVAAHYLQEIPRPRLTSSLPVGIQCSGGEPFWSLDLLVQGEMTLRTPEGAVTEAIGWSTASSNEGDLRHAFGTAEMNAVLQRGLCTNAGTGRQTGWSLDLVMLGETPSLLSGCCVAY